MPHFIKTNVSAHALYRRSMTAALLFGLLFPFGALGMEMLIRRQPPSLGSIAVLHQLNPLLYIIDLVPLVLCTFAHFTIRFFIRAQEHHASLVTARGSLEREQSEKTLLFEQMQSVLNLSPVSYVLIAADGCILFVNKATESILGSADTQGQNIFAFRTVKNTHFEAALKRTREGSREQLDAYRHVSATTGEAKVLNISMMPFKKDPNSGLHEILMMSTDRTQEELLLAKVEANFFNVVKGLARALDARDRYTSHHSANVKGYTSIIAYHADLDSEERNNILVAAELHDIGKIGVMDSILNKEGPLSHEEYESMRTHPTIGADIFAGIDGYQQISDIVRHHHERVDGNGYPAGLKGEAIPRGASIIAIADAFDAMTTDRVYRKALPIEEAVGELKKGRGTQFHSAYVDIFVKHFKY